MEFERQPDAAEVIKEDLRKGPSSDGEQAEADPSADTVMATVSPLTTCGAQQPGGGEEKAPRVQTNRHRCFSCNKKVGPTGLACKCGFVFCTKHRHAEEHHCSFDFKSQGREQLAKSVVGGGQFLKVAAI